MRIGPERELLCERIVDLQRVPRIDDLAAADLNRCERLRRRQFALQAGAQPMLLVCSSQRDSSCRQAHDFARRLQATGSRAEVLEQARSHREINLQLGADSAYTGALQAFIDSLLKA